MISLQHTVQTLLNNPTYEETTAMYDESDLNAIWQDTIKTLPGLKNTPKGLGMIQFPPQPQLLSESTIHLHFHFLL